MTDIRIGQNSVFYVDEFWVHNRVFTEAEQCTVVIGGTWTGTACTLPATVVLYGNSTEFAGSTTWTANALNGPPITVTQASTLSTWL